MRVIKRKKGNKEYFYLQHSFREKGKVVTKERYLGKSVPKNVPSIMAAFKLRLRKTLYAKLKRIRESFQKEWRSIPEIAKEKELQDY